MQMLAFDGHLSHACARRLLNGRPRIDHRKLKHRRGWPTFQMQQNAHNATQQQPKAGTQVQAFPNVLQPIRDMHDFLAGRTSEATIPVTPETAPVIESVLEKFYERVRRSA